MRPGQRQRHTCRGRREPADGEYGPVLGRTGRPSMVRTATARWTIGLLLATLWIATPGCGGPFNRSDSGAGAAEQAAGNEDDHEEGIIELAPEAVARIGLTTSVAGPRALDRRRATTGRIGFNENRLAHVGSRVSGRLAEVPGELGATVAEGDTLALVDSLEVGEAKAAFLRARARAEVSERRYERERSLRADRIASEQEVLDAEAAAREAAVDLAAARESLRLLGLDDDEIDGLSWAESSAAMVALRAPFAGRIVAREATLGELVAPEDVLFTIADLTVVWLWVDLYERDLAHVSPGLDVAVRLDAWPGETFPGALAYIADELDPDTQAVRARVDLPNPDHRLKPGMFARVSIAGRDDAQIAPVLAVPRTAVQRDGPTPIAFVRLGPGRFERRALILGAMNEEWVEVVDGIVEGEEVVIEGAFLLRSQASADQLGGHH